MPVKISELIDEMDMQMDEYNTYLNKETNIIVTVSNEALSIAKNQMKMMIFLNTRTGRSKSLWML